MSEIPQYVSLRTAMEQTEATDQKEFIRVAKLHKCYFEKAGIVRIDVVTLQRLIDQDFAEAQEQAANRKPATRSAGSDLGLVKARIKLFADRIEKKDAKIAAMEADVKAAKTPYERKQAEKKLQKLLTERAVLEEGHKRDLARLEELMNDGKSGISE